MRTPVNGFVRAALSTSILLGFLASPGWAQKVYTSVPGSSSVVVIDGSTNTVIGSISIPPATPGGSPFAPDFIALTPDAKFLYVVDQQSTAVDIIDTAADTVVTTIPGPAAGCPAEIAFSPDGLKGYLTDPCNRTLSVIDTTTHTRTTVLTLTGNTFSGSGGIAISPDGSKVYLGLLTGLGIYDTGAQTFTTVPLVPSGNSFSTTISELAASADGTQVFVGAESALYAFQTASMTFVFLADISCTNGGIGITPDGTSAFVGDQECGGITEINTATDSLTSFTLPDNFPLYIAFTSDNQRAYASGANSTQVFGVSTNASVAVIPVAATPTFGIAVMPTSPGTRTATVTTLASSANPSTFGNAIVFTANVAARSGTPTGIVTFFEGMTSLGASPLSSSGSATFTISSLATGTHAITATYGGDSNFAPSTSAPPLVQTVNPLPNPLPTTTSISVAADPSTYGQNLTLSAQVSSSLSGITGTVTFTSGAIVLGKANVVGGIATLGVILPNAGMPSVAAAYSGDSNFSPSTSVSLPLTVKPEATSCTIAVVDPTNPTAPRAFDPASVSLTVFPQNLGATIRGSISASDNGVALVEITGGTFADLLTPGTHTYVGTYVGDGNNLPSQCSFSLTIAKASTTITLTSSLNPSPQGANVIFSAQINNSVPSFVPSGTVVFSDGGTPLASVQVDPFAIATLSTNSLAPGAHSITATYTGDQSFLSSSAGLTQTVTASGGGGGGGTGTCACSKTGPYTTPAAPVTPALGKQTPAGTYLSPNGKYELSFSFNAPQTVTIAVNLAGTANQVLPPTTLPITAANGLGFSPDDDRLVVSFIDPSTIVPSFQKETYVYDLTGGPAKVIVHIPASNAGFSQSFSPSGRYFVYQQILGASQADLQIYKVQGVTGQDLVFDSGNYSFSVGSGVDLQTGTIAFSPDIPETSFIYAFTTGQTTFQWNLVNLASGKLVAAVNYDTPLAQFQYSPCADVAGVLWQVNSTTAQADLYDTATGKTLSGSGAAFPANALITSGAALETDPLLGQDLTYPANGQVVTTLLSPRTCDLPNTPSGTNVNVTPKDAGTSTAPISVTFASVTVPGQTTVTVSTAGAAPPSSFELGNPPTYYDLTTTAIFSGGATVCINYGGISFNNQAGIRLYHFENGSWVDRTTSVDTATHTVCGTVSSFSPFALFEPQAPLPANVAASGGTPQTTSIFSAFPTGLRAMVTDASGNPVSGAIVNFAAPAVGATGVFANSGVLATVTTDTSGVASAPALNADGVVGSYTITATVNGVAIGANFLLTNSPAATTLSLASTPGSVTYGSPVTLIATLATAIGTPTGTVAFFDGGTPLGTSPLNGVTGTLTVPFLSAGIHSVSASYSGDNSFNGSVSSVLSITVSPAALAIVASNVTKILDAPAPSFTWTASGFVNGDTASVLTAKPTCSTAALSTSPVGNYPITCAGAMAANYTISYVAGTLKVLYATALGHVIQPPINADGSSLFKQGRTVPAIFKVYDANGASIGTPGVVASFFLSGIQSGTFTTTVEDVVDTNNPDAAFRWDPTNQQWIFNISTGNLVGGSTYIYTITLNDGSAIVFQYGLR